MNCILKLQIRAFKNIREFAQDFQENDFDIGISK